MRLLLTRFGENGTKSAQMLRERGFDVIHEPLMGISMIHGPIPVLQGAQGVIATSANGVRALAERMGTEMLGELPIYTVGNATAKTARDIFQNNRIYSADGNVGKLAQMIRQYVNPKNGTLLYVAGSIRAGNLQKTLLEHGYSIKMAILYKCIPVNAISHKTFNMLRDEEINIATFYSPQMARTYSKLAALAFAKKAAHPLYGCISVAVAQALYSLNIPNGHILIAKHATQEAMFDLLASIKMDYEKRITKISKKKTTGQKQPT